MYHPQNGGNSAPDGADSPDDKKNAPEMRFSYPQERQIEEFSYP
jgi:hypothetical protein